MNIKVQGTGPSLDQKGCRSVSVVMHSPSEVKELLGELGGPQSWDFKDSVARFDVTGAKVRMTYDYSAGYEDPDKPEDTYMITFSDEDRLPASLLDCLKKHGANLAQYGY